MTTLESYVIRSQRRFPQATGELTQLLLDLALASKAIGREIRQVLMRDLGDARALAESTEARMDRLERHAREQMIRALDRSGTACMLVHDHPGAEIERLQARDGRYLVVTDPLDATGNIAFNASVSTLFSIYKRTSDAGKNADPKEVLQPGYAQVAAGYVLYGTSTMLVLGAEGMGVAFFTLDPHIGEYLLIRDRIRIPASGKTFSVNMGWQAYRDAPTRAYFESLSAGGRTYRYAGSMVADVHRILMEGGLYAYPADRRHPQGKLNLLNKCAPLSLLVELAGGKATDGRTRILEIRPTHIHQTCPIFIGSDKNVNEAVAACTPTGSPISAS